MSAFPILPIETHYDGYRFRSRTEARWAVFFKEIGLRYEYEKEGYSLQSGWYLPDFYLPQIGYWFKVKGVEPSAQEVLLASQLSSTTNHPAMIAVGAPESSPQILHIPLIMSAREADRGTGTFEPRFWFVDDRKNDGEFWLDSEEHGCFSIGPAIKNAREHDGYPCVREITQRGYNAARAARFERRA